MIRRGFFFPVHIAMKSQLRSGIVRSQEQGPRSGVKKRVKLAAGYIHKSRLSEDACKRLVVPCVPVLSYLAKNIIDVIQLRFTPLRMDSLQNAPNRISRIPIASQGILDIGNSYIKKPFRQQNTTRFREKMRDFVVKIKMLEHMLAINMGDAGVGKRPFLA